MPGTHYDNDHSFIEDLPFDHKFLANQIIRQDALATLLESLQTLNNPVFVKKPNEPELNNQDKKRILYACLVAKVTAFDKTLFIRETHQQFLQQILFLSLRSLLQPYFPGQTLKNDAILHYLKLSHPQTYEWIYRDDEESKRKLAIHKRQGNNRRYFRYKADLKYHFIRIGSHEGIDELPKDIYSSGIQHFTKLVNQKLDQLKKQYQLHIEEALAESFPKAHQLFEKVLERLEYLREVLNGISVGRIRIDEATTALNALVEQSLDYSVLSGNIRTEGILREFNEKFQQITANTRTLLQNSTPHRLYEGPVLEKLKIDSDIEIYKEKAQKSQSKLLKSFIELYYYAVLLEKIYNNIAAGNYIIIFPEYWSQEYRDASPGGFAFYSQFLVSINDILELYIQINKSTDPNEPDYEIVHQRAKVVRINTLEEQGVYQISCQFLNITEHKMSLLRKTLQSKEIIDAFESADFLDPMLN